MALRLDERIDLDVGRDVVGGCGQRERTTITPWLAAALRRTSA